MVNIRTAISTSAAALVALSTVTGVSAATAIAEESTGAQPGTDAAASEDSDAQAADEAQPGTEIDNDSAGNNGEEEESTASDAVQPGTTADNQQSGLANQEDIPKHHVTDNATESAPAQPGTTQTTNNEPQEASNAQPGTATDDPSATATAAPAGESQPSAPEANASDAGTGTADEVDNENSQNSDYVSRPQPVESNAATQTATRWSDEIVYDEPSLGQQNTVTGHEEPVESHTYRPDYEFAAYTSEDAGDFDRNEDADEQEETAPAPRQADEEGQPEKAPVEVAQPVQQPVESDTAHQVAPAPAETVTQAPVNDMQPVDTNEVAGASASLTAGQWEVSAQGEAYPLEGTIAVDTGMDETSIALPSDEIAAVQQFGQDTVKALPTEQQDALNQAHKAVIEQIEHLPQKHSAELGSVTAEVNIDHAE